MLVLGRKRRQGKKKKTFLALALNFKKVANRIPLSASIYTFKRLLKHQIAFGDEWPFSFQGPALLLINDILGPRCNDVRVYI